MDGDLTSYVDTKRARSDEQLEVLEQIRNEGICPFCSEQLQRFHKQPILKEGVHWIVTTNQWPYKFTRYNFLIILKTHAETLNEMPDGAGKELMELAQWIEREYGLESGAIGFRFGRLGKNGASVRHLHAQILVADTEAPGYKKVRFPMG